ncbi:MAG: DUF6165 family protein [Alphaproteobacteria bacterium]|nr:DUF6165 family protein [Alphaproteobacteria bacterium]
MGDPAANIQVPISPGELIDRLTILEIKSERLADPEKAANVRHELGLLAEAAREAIPETRQIQALKAELKTVNEILWRIEDDIRDCERQGDFGDAFIELARSVYRTNDERARLKGRINEALGSAIRDEKSYSPY